jgi:hypothetical protein
MHYHVNPICCLDTVLDCGFCDPNSGLYQSAVVSLQQSVSKLRGQSSQQSRAAEYSTSRLTVMASRWIKIDSGSVDFALIKGFERNPAKNARMCCQDHHHIKGVRPVCKLCSSTLDLPRHNMASKEQLLLDGMSHDDTMYHAFSFFLFPLPMYPAAAAATEDYRSEQSMWLHGISITHSRLHYYPFYRQPQSLIHHYDILYSK